MRELTTKDIRLLDSAHLPLEQRAIVEKYWREQDESNPVTNKTKVLVATTLYATTAFMLLVNFFPALEPFANIAKVLIWCGFIIALPVAWIISLIGAGILREKKRQKLLGRGLISLLSEYSALRKYLGQLNSIVLVSATAAAGYTITAVFLILALLAVYVMVFMVKSIIRENLKDLADGELGRLKRAKVVFQ